TVYTTVTNGSPKQGYSGADIYTISSKDCGATWQGPNPVVQGISAPSYQTTTFREGIVDTFGVGNAPTGTPTTTSRSGNSYPLYVAYEDGGGGLSNVYIVSSTDGGLTWSAPERVNDNPDADRSEALQPTLTVAPSGTVGVAVYDPRLPRPQAGTPHDLRIHLRRRDEPKQLPTADRRSCGHAVATQAAGRGGRPAAPRGREAVAAEPVAARTPAIAHEKPRRETPTASRGAD